MILLIKRILFALLHPNFLFRRLRLGAMKASIIDLEEIKAIYSDIFYVVEAGASDGVDTELMLKELPIVKLYAFEPVQNSYESLMVKFSGESRIELSNSALSSEEGTSKVYVSSDENAQNGTGSSSLLQPNLHKSIFPSITFPPEAIQQVKTVTLDGWAYSTRINGLDLMWLDLQGMELKVLMSGRRLLENTKLLHIELSRIALYDQACTKREVEGFLKEMGFVSRIMRVGTLSGNALFINTRFF